jgi:ABC-type glutathione transport system ATPase component
VRLGQSATTLSGGEAQRVKLARELSKRDTGKTLYILDEPTTGLHFADIQQLLDVLHRLRDHGNTLVVIEHNLDVIKTADWLIDMGPEGGSRGGQVVVTGTPEEVAAHPDSHTGHYLKQILGDGVPVGELSEALIEVPAEAAKTAAAKKTTAKKPATKRVPAKKTPTKRAPATKVAAKKAAAAKPVTRRTTAGL